MNPTRLPLKKDLLILFGLALAVRLSAALPQQQPNYMDAAYSYVNALNLAAGRGFVEDFVWNYLNDPASPPQPSHLYWMPLTSIIAWLGLSIGELAGWTPYRAAQLPFVVLSAGLAPLSYWIAVRLSAQVRPDRDSLRRHGWLAGLLMIFSGFYFPFWTAIDNFTPFALFGSLALVLAWLGLEHATAGPARSFAYFIGAGGCVGLAHLARADGPLLLIAISAYTCLRSCFKRNEIFVEIAPLTPQRGELVCELTSAPPSGGLGGLFKQLLRFSFGGDTGLVRLVIAGAVGYVAVMLPWFVRNWQITGAILAPGGTQTIWLTTYDQLFSYGHLPSPQAFLAQGFAEILRGRWWALITNVQTVVAVWGMIFLTPLVIVGAWVHRRAGLIQVAGLYGALLFLALTLLFAFPGARGGLFHSGAALLPVIYPVAVLGLDQAVEWVAARRRGWRVSSAEWFFSGGLVLLAVALSSFVYYNRVLRDDAWNQADIQYRAVAGWVAEADPGAVVMINNPPAYRFHGGGLSLVVPNNGVEQVLEAARHYNVDYLVLDPNHPAPLAEIYEQTRQHPQLTLIKTLGDIHIFEIQ